MYLCRRYLADTARRLMETLTVTRPARHLQYSAGFASVMRSGCLGFPRIVDNAVAGQLNPFNKDTS
jgi:hypothetical protein